MPFYEYRCNACGAEFELMLRFSEAGQRQTCPQCASQKTQKKLSMVSSLGSAGSAASESSASSCGSRGGFS